MGVLQVGEDQGIGFKKRVLEFVVRVRVGV
jgi:hypothetical protein